MDRRTALARRLARAGGIAACAAAVALAAPALAQAASLDVSVSPAQPSYADEFSVKWTFDAESFPADPTTRHFSHPYTYANVGVVLISAGGPGCAATEKETLEYAYSEVVRGFRAPDSHFYDAYSDVEFHGTGKPFVMSDRWDNINNIAEGDYILCGYLSDTANNQSENPDVGPVAHRFTVRPARSAVSLSASTRSVRPGEEIALVAPWSAETQYNDFQLLASWDPSLGVMMFPDRGQPCPATLPENREDPMYANSGLASKRLHMDEWRDESDPDRIDRGKVRMKGLINRRDGDYLLCAYVFRVSETFEDSKPGPILTVFTEAHSSPVRLRVTSPSRACKKAERKLASLKAQLAEAKAVRRWDSTAKAKKRVKKLKRKLKRVRKTARNAC